MSTILKKIRGASALLIGAVILSAASCEVQGEKEKEFNKDYKVNVAWKIPLSVDTNDRLEIDGNTLFTAEVFINGMCAINLDTGAILWRKEYPYVFRANPVVSGDYLYGIDTVDRYDLPTVVKIDKYTGDFIKAVDVGDSYNWTVRMFTLDAYRNKLYWGTAHIGENNGLLEFDLSTDTYKIVHKTNGDYKGEYRTWDPIYGEAVEENIIKDGDVVYISKCTTGYLESSTTEEDVYPSIIALDTSVADENGMYKVLWKLKHSCAFSLVPDNAVVGDKLYSTSGDGVVCINKNTGSVIWMNDSISATGYGATYHAGRLYFQNLAVEKNLFCLDAETGKVLWNTTGTDGYTGITPQVNEGIVYFVQQTSIVLADAKSGKVLGIDESIGAGGLSTGRSVRYKDLMIFKKLCEAVVAVKMDAHKDF